LNISNPLKAVILVSGGLDSATTLAIAKSQGYACYALTFDYGQRHKAELQAARQVTELLEVVEHKTLKLNLDSIGGSALTDNHLQVPIAGLSDDIPITYVPARNSIFLSIALGWAEVLSAHHLFIGVNAVDFSGYPDCRADFITAFEKMANLATQTGRQGNHFTIHTPLIHLSKAEIIQQGINLGIDFSLTVSCYQASIEGNACGVCDACRLRKQGFQTAHISDPTHYTSN